MFDMRGLPLVWGYILGIDFGVCVSQRLVKVTLVLNVVKYSTR